MLNSYKTLQTNWKDIIEKIFNENNENEILLSTFLKNEETKFKDLRSIFPPKEKIFNAFSFFNIEELKVVIVGQDPYHQKGQANGLAFSVEEGVKIPPSLRNILKEIRNNYNYVDLIDKEIKNGDLTHLAKQGVLLLNRSLTVRESAANSHRNYWLFFTNELIKYIAQNTNNIVFMLWGNDAKSLKKILIQNDIDTNNHYFLEATHPSPLSANRSGWFGNNHFKKTNELLLKIKKNEINWLNT